MSVRKSIALQYNDLLPAPFVLAKGKGELASKLLQLAREHGVDVIEEADLAESLFWVDIGEFIPEEFYSAVAEILAYVLRLSGEQGPKRR